MTRLDERRAFLDAILANPADDTPRLVFADWLEEHGEAERAEFIRVQCELEPMRTHGHGASNPHGGDCPECLRAARLERREKELSMHTVFWGVDLPLPAMPQNGCCVWRRGFVAEITLSCADWLRHREGLLAAAPLERVTLTNLPDGLAGEQGTVVLQRNQTFVYVVPESGEVVDLSFAVSPEAVLEAMAKAMYARLDWELLRGYSTQEDRILHGNPDAPAPQGILHTARRPR